MNDLDWGVKNWSVDWKIDKLIDLVADWCTAWQIDVMAVSGCSVSDRHCAWQLRQWSVFFERGCTFFMKCLAAAAVCHLNYTPRILDGTHFGVLPWALQVECVSTWVTACITLISDRKKNSSCREAASYTFPVTGSKTHYCTSSVSEWALHPPSLTFTCPFSCSTMSCPYLRLVNRCYLYNNKGRVALLHSLSFCALSLATPVVWAGKHGALSECKRLPLPQMRISLSR